MGHVDIYQCDRERCKEEKPAEYLPSTDGGSGGPFLPLGWLSLSTSRDGLGQGFTFCSIKCLAIWARMEREVKP